MTAPKLIITAAAPNKPDNNRQRESGSHTGKRRQRSTLTHTLQQQLEVQERAEVAVVFLDASPEASTLQHTRIDTGRQ
jgi:hypothetical protein